MLRVAIAASDAVAAAIAAELAHAGMHVAGELDVAALEAGVFGADAASASIGAVWELLDRSDVLLVQPNDVVPGRMLLGPELCAVCDRRGIRIVPLVDSDDARRRAQSLGLEHTAAPSSPASVIAAIRGEVRPRTTLPPRATSSVADDVHPTSWHPGHAVSGVPVVPLAPAPVPAPAPEPVLPPTPGRGQILAVWGPGGAPGRSTLAIELAYELARGGRTVALIDADTHGPSLALALGLADEGPGFAAACRAAGAGMLDTEELARISVPIAHPEGSLRLLTGLNRPARWPELSEERVSAALRVCREWVDYVVVDVAASLECDEEIVSDIDGLRRNAAAFGALRAADQLIAVASIEPVAIARFVRGYAELRALIGATPITVVANRLRPGALGADARGQVRAALLRFAGVESVAFVPLDPRSTDAAMLAASPIGARMPNAPLVAAVRRLVGGLVSGAKGAVPRHPEPDGTSHADKRTHRATRVRRRAMSQRAEVEAPAT